MILPCSVTVVQSGTDYKPFIQTIGVPCLDIRYLYDKVCNTFILNLQMEKN